MTRLLLAIVVAMSALAGGALAQSFPARPITLINPYAAGGLPTCSRAPSPRG